MYGETNNLKVSFQFAIPSKSGAGGEGGTDGSSTDSSDTVIDTIEASSIEHAIALADGYISKQINLSHCKVLVISEEFASLRYF